jgi:hypothetical protein
MTREVRIMGLFNKQQGDDGEDKAIGSATAVLESLADQQEEAPGASPAALADESKSATESSEMIGRPDLGDAEEAAGDVEEGGSGDLMDIFTSEEEDEMNRSVLTDELEPVEAVSLLETAQQLDSRLKAMVLAQEAPGQAEAEPAKAA